MKKGGQDARSRAAQGVAEGDGTAERIDLGALEAEDLLVGKYDSSESLVELPDSDLVLGDAGTLQSNGNGLGGGDGEINRGHGGVGVADNFGEDTRVLAVLLSNGAVAEDESAGAVVEGGRVGGGDRASSVADKGRLQGGDLFKLDVVEALVGIDDGLALAALDSHGGNFFGKGLVGPGLLGVAVRLDGVLVLLLAGNVVLLDGVLAAVAHVELLVDIGEAVFDQTVLHLGVAKGGESAGAVDVVRNAGHVLHATGNLGLGKAHLDVLGGEDDSLEAGGADLVDGDGFGGLGQTSKDGGLTGGGLADVAAQDVAHVDIGNLVGGDLGLFQSRLDGDGAELGGADVEERAVELADELECAPCGGRKAGTYLGSGSSSGAQNIGILNLLAED